MEHLVSDEYLSLYLCSVVVNTVAQYAKDVGSIPTWNQVFFQIYV